METKPKGNKDLRRLILDETRHLLVTDGYQNLSMRKIARAIGYSATSIYLYFENKDALFHALIDEGMERMYEHLHTAAAQHTDVPVTRLRALCLSYIDFGLQNPEYYEVMFMLHPEQMARYPVDKYRRARRNLALITAALVDGRTEGSLHVEDPETATNAIWAALHGAVALLIAQRVDIKIDHEVFIEAIVGQTIQGYAGVAVSARGN